MRKPMGYWTEERIREEALKYQTRTSFRVGSPAYQAAHRKGIVDDVCKHMLTYSEVVTKWDTAMLRTEAAKYQTRTEFKEGSSGAYKTVQARGLLGELCSHMPKNTRLVWTEEALRQEALKYSTRAAFGLGPSAGAYNKALRLGVLDLVCAHMPPPSNTPLTLDFLTATAAKYDTRSDFQHGDGSAYQCAYTRGLLDGICGHMEDRAPSDNDTMYIWRAPGEYFNGKPVYKIGVTSARLGERRIRQVNKDAVIVILQPVQGKATDHEGLLLMFGDDPQYATGDGKTEFRALSDSELQEAINYIEGVAI